MKKNHATFSALVIGIFEIAAKIWNHDTISMDFYFRQIELKDWH